MKTLYLTDQQTEQLFTTIRWFFLIICGALYLFEPIQQPLNLNPFTFEYLLIFSLSYTLILQLALMISSKREKLQSFTMKLGIFFDFIATFWFIALTGSANSLFVPIIYVHLMHATILWRTRGLVIALMTSIVGYSVVCFYPPIQITTEKLWAFAFDIVFFILVGIFAAIIALRERKHHKEKMAFQNQSVSDYVTGLYNHRSFQNTLGKLVNTNKSFSLILADIDDFKKINDQYGHTVGDQVLSAYGNTLKHELNNFDSYAFRYGGEEFAIILFNTRKRSLETQIQQWNKLFEKGINLLPELNHETITISYGVSFRQEADTKEDILNRADEYLYLAKARGKNCAMFQESYERVGE
ncbi:GGDEF domain-containing protein [Tenuibacillus multivorans]|uniref:Diguanylate cyclase (GGDEF) domain-containing protein n=1 Tax=Tenuibacillus multivorans TaxID=237069 RepID=A0A1H0CPJ0_9BACI|nr:GGDEF domain-containing protein [Tenuibacillus multivorans]GEL76217.1 hypothetical protein TMU01_04520 [Tenuibacillus multivorans]SDN59774.1 diguanylate cyclase (GGDEF) domain-containing protein [Tenuibacillus multivorans]